MIESEKLRQIAVRAEELHDQAEESVQEDGGARFPGLSYEEGVRDATAWLLGLTDVHPLEE